MSAPHSVRLYDEALVPPLALASDSVPHDGPARHTSSHRATLSTQDVIEERRVVDEFLAEAEGELTPELDALLNDANAKVEDKIEATARFVMSERARAKAMEAEIDRLATRRTAALARAAYNEDVRIRALLNALGVEKVKGALATVQIQKNPPSLIVDATQWDEPAVRGLAMSNPAFVSHTPETYRVNKTAILREIKQGAPVPVGMTVVVNDSVRTR